MELYINRQKKCLLRLLRSVILGTGSSEILTKLIRRVISLERHRNDGAFWTITRLLPGWFLAFRVSRVCIRYEELSSV